MTQENRGSRDPSRKWAPFLVGLLISPIFALVMMFAWKEFEPIAAVWTVLVALFGWPRRLWRTPFRRSISTAIVIGTLAPVVAWLWQN